MTKTHKAKIGDILTVNGMQYLVNASGQLVARTEDKPQVKKVVESKPTIQDLIKLAVSKKVKHDLYKLGTVAVVQLHGKVTEDNYAQFLAEYNLDTIKLGSGMKYNNIVLYYSKSDISDVRTFLSTHLLSQFKA